MDLALAFAGDHVSLSLSLSLAEVSGREETSLLLSPLLALLSLLLLPSFFLLNIHSSTHTAILFYETCKGEYCTLKKRLLAASFISLFFSTFLLFHLSLSLYTHTHTYIHTRNPSELGWLQFSVVVSFRVMTVPPFLVCPLRPPSHVRL